MFYILTGNSRCMKKSAMLILLLLAGMMAFAQGSKLTCFEKQRKNPDGVDPILVKTCYLKNYKFVTTSHPDHVGRYVFEENEVYVNTKGKFTKTTYSRVFSQRQARLLALINKRIRQDFDALKKDPDTAECLSDLESIPDYKMDDLEVQFNGNEIWFIVHWGLSGACRAVDGSIVNLKLESVRQYIR